jgi:hypothetical protein
VCDEDCARQLRRFVALALAMSPVALLLCLAGAPQTGVALGLFATDPAYDYGALLDEIVDTGARHVLVAVVWTQRTTRSVDIHRQPGLTPDDDTVVRTLAQARARGLDVMLFPIVRTERQARGEWRGTIDPAAGIDAWFSSYRSFLRVMASLATRGGASTLSVGSELLSLERHEQHWRALIADVRARFAGKLLYSANWDHFEDVPFLDAVDEIGVTAYFELAHDDALPDDRALDRAWAGPRASLFGFAARWQKSLVITEIG